MVQDLLFEVVGRNKSEKLTKEGKREVIFRISLKGKGPGGGSYKLTISDTDQSLLQKYPFGGEVPVKLSACSQTTLSDTISKDAELASEDAGRAK
jgi:hypothetical protein